MVQAESIKVRHLAWMVAGAWKPCPALIWHESKAAAERATNCLGLCDGTGRVWALITQGAKLGGYKDD